MAYVTVNELTLKHSYHCAKVNIVIEPMLHHDETNLDTVKSSASIHFSDLLEVDELIKALEFFKQKCSAYIGKFEYRNLDI